MCAINRVKKPSFAPITKNRASSEIAITISGDIITTNSMPLTTFLPLNW
ncbi:Uncharacterised protein [Vibrio cholerae]|nr:Uncharacterised protein [Vibrio cholerae]